MFVFTAFSLLASCQQKEKKATADPWAAYRKAYALLEVNRDSAFLHFNKLAENSKDRQQMALAYYNMGLIQSYAGDHYGAQESLTLSLNALDESRPEDRNYLATDFNELAMTTFNLQEYTASLAYCEKARALTTDPALLQFIYTNQGNAYQKLQQYEQALTSYRQVIKLSGLKGSVYARGLTSLATTKWLKDKAYNAAPELHTALAIRLKENDTWGLNSSYAHLADFYGGTNQDSALFYASKMLSVATSLQSPDDRLEAFQKLILFSRPEVIKPLYLRYQTLNDSVVGVRRAAKNQFALIRYGVEKNKAENLSLQKDNTEKKYQLVFVLVLAACALAFGFFWYRRRQWLQEMDKQQAVLETRQKASKKVHDALANHIYLIMKKVQFETDLDKEMLVGDIDEVYQRARDLSYEIVQQPDEHFQQTISAMLRSFAGEDLKVVLVGNSGEFWSRVKDTHQVELKYVLQELMVNMKKHSRADNVILKFGEAGQRGWITYLDNGVGIPPDTPPGNGLKNTENRIKEIGGAITFDAQTVGGLEIRITFPLS